MKASDLLDRAGSTLPVSDPAEIVSDMVVDHWCALDDAPHTTSLGHGRTFDASVLKECEPFASDGPFSDALHALSPDRVFFTDATPRDIWPVNVAVMKLDGDTSEFLSIRTASRAELRGAKFLGTSAVTVGGVRIVGGKVVDCGTDRVWWNGHRWIAEERDYWVASWRAQQAEFMANPKGLYTDTTQCITNAGIGMGVAFSRDYDWRVIVGSSSGASLSLATTPLGVRDFWKDREIEYGRNRRAALKHWVRRHYRRLRTAEDDEVMVEVREHLRGRTEFKWLGLPCVVVVSPADMRKYEAAKAVRK